MVCNYNFPVSAEGESSSSSEEDLKSLATLVENKLNLTVISDFIVLSERTKKKCPDLEEKLDVSCSYFVANLMQ